jgi:hypothetical protein
VHAGQSKSGVPAKGALCSRPDQKAAAFDNIVHWTRNIMVYYPCVVCFAGLFLFGRLVIGAPNIWGPVPSALPLPSDGPGLRPELRVAVEGLHGR